MTRLIMIVLWPSFLVAAAAEGFFFSLFDPHDLSLLSSHVNMEPKAFYTLGFFCFWLFCSLASGLTCYLMWVPNDRRIHP